MGDITEPRRFRGRITINEHTQEVTTIPSVSEDYADKFDQEKKELALVRSGKAKI